MPWLPARQEGQATVEYAIVAVLISVIAVVFMREIGIATAGHFADLVSLLP